MVTVILDHNTRPGRAPMRTGQNRTEQNRTGQDKRGGSMVCLICVLWFVNDPILFQDGEGPMGLLTGSAHFFLFL